MTTPTSTSPATERRDGARDFDFLIGRWTSRNRKLAKPLSGEDRWETFDSKLTVQALPGGFGNVDLFEPLGDWRPGFLGLGLRLYNPATRLWSIFWLTNKGAGMVADNGQLEAPVVGGFDAAGVGTLHCRELWEGRPIVVQYRWSDITPRSARWQQAFSLDDGASWEVNWIADHTRVTVAEG